VLSVPNGTELKNPFNGTELLPVPEKLQERNGNGHPFFGYQNNGTERLARSVWVPENGTGTAIRSVGLE